MPFPVSEELIIAAERQLGGPLLPELRDRLLRDNGGEIEAAGDIWMLHPIWDPTDNRRIKRTINHIVHETKLAREWRGFPGDAISIAINGSGDHLIIQGNSDKVEYWDYETGTHESIRVNWTFNGSEDQYES